MTATTDEPLVRDHSPASQCATMLKYLKKYRRATGSQFLSMGIGRFGARLKNLREEGWIVESVRLRDGLWEYRFLGHRDDSE